MDDKNDVFYKLSKISLISSVAGICTLGICPAFGAIALSVAAVMKKKQVKPGKKTVANLKKATVLGIISLIFFVIDLVLAIYFYSRLSV